MINPKNTLELLYNDEIIFSSDKTKLRPLMDAIILISEKYPNYTGFRLNDKVIGIAAAKLIIYSGKIVEIKTDVASESAINILSENNIKIVAEKIVTQIFNNDKTGQCPMELKSIDLSPKEFYEELKRLMNIN
ncbi:MAG: DUF1893 domain-containing protein [Candidatus Woesearchaeota archaeon]